MNFQVIFHLDGTGIYYDPREPIHLDALLAWALTPMQVTRRGISRSDAPDDIALPLMSSAIQGERVYHASAVIPPSGAVTAETLRFWRKKFRQNRIDVTEGSPNLQNGVYREYNMPVPLLLVPQMIAYASGNSKEVKRLLKKHIKSLGKKRAYGYGRVVSVDCVETPADWSLVKDGIAMRWLPDANGLCEVRPRPPYWNAVGRVACCEVGAAYEMVPGA